MWTEARVLALAAALAGGTAWAQAPAPPEEPETPPPGQSSGEPAEEGAEAASAERPSLFAATLVLGGAADRLEFDDPAFADVDDDVYVAGADIALGGKLSERTDLALEYAPEYERFDSTGDHTLHHLAGARFARRFDRDLTFSLVGSYLDTDDPGRFLDDALLLLRRTPYRQVAGRAALDWRGRLAGVRLEAGRVETDVDPAAGPFAAGLDQSEDIATVGLDRSIGPRSEIFLNYSYAQVDARPLVVDPAAPPADLLDQPIQQAMAGWRFAPVESLSLLLSGGVLDDAVEQSWIAAAELERRGRGSAWRLRYDRSAATLGGQIDGSEPVPGAPSGALVRGGITETGTLGFTVGVGRRFSWEQEVRAMRTRFPGAVDGDELESLVASALFSVKTVRALDVFLSVDWFDQQSESFAGGSRLRTMLGLRFGLVGPPRTFEVFDEPAAPESAVARGGYR